MDKAPNEMFIGVINPYALTEAITGRKFDWSDPKSIQIIEDTLETNLFLCSFTLILFSFLALSEFVM